MSRTLTASDRSSLIRLASTLPVGSPERKAILAGLAQTKVAAADLVDETYRAVRDRWFKFNATMLTFLQGQLKKFSVALKKMGYTLDVAGSYVDWTRDREGVYPEFMLVFKDTKERSADQVEKDLRMLGVYGYPREVGGMWQVRFGGK